MSVRPIRPDDLPAIIAMMRTLWPTSEDYDFADESVFFWQADGARQLGGFVSFSVRPWAEGCDSAPVPATRFAFRRRRETR
jgi:hypothetical protein